MVYSKPCFRAYSTLSLWLSPVPRYELGSKCNRPLRPILRHRTQNNRHFCCHTHKAKFTTPLFCCLNEVSAFIKCPDGKKNELKIEEEGGNQLYSRARHKTHALLYICCSEVFCMIHTHCTHFLPPFSPMHSRIAVCSLCVQPLFDTRQQNTI